MTPRLAVAFAFPYSLLRWRESWKGKLAEYLLGRISEDEILAVAASYGPQSESVPLCNAWYCIGVKRLLAGDETAAVEDFQKCVAIGRRNQGVYGFAEAELRALGRQ